jgi:hypothetical protein
MENYSPQNDYDQTLPALDSASNNLNKFESNLTDIHITLGFDGYIDTLYRMVKNRKSAQEVEYYTSMKDFGQYIINSAGSSGSVERILKKKLGGGFTVNTGRAIANMAPQSQVKIIGALGYPTQDPIYNELPGNVSLHSIGNCGLTLAMEFEDGKIMSQDMEGINNLDWNSIVTRIGGEDQLIEIFNNADIIGNGHWSLLPHFNDIWNHIIYDIIPSITNPRDKFFFVDPADLQKRSSKDIREMLNLLGKINDAIPVILSVNDKEAADITKILNKEGVPLVDKKEITTYDAAGMNINNVINLAYFAIHDPHFSTLTGPDFHNWIAEGFTSKPKFTTGAGDHFNAGVLLAIKAGFTPAEALILANSATAIFVRTGESPSIANLRYFLQNYIYYLNADDDSFDLTAF